MNERQTIQEPDFTAITETQRANWSLGDYQAIALQTMDMNEELVRDLDPRPGERILDVACGSGNGALVAARRDCHVTGIDLVPAWIERARLRAEAEGINATFEAGDAQALPFQDSCFEVVMSVVGVLFAPDQKRTADELLRVTRPGGRIGLMSHASGGLVENMFAAMAAFMPPPPTGVSSPFRWGTQQGIEELLDRGTTNIENRRKRLNIYSRSVNHQVDLFRNFYGPTKALFDSLSYDNQRQARMAMVEALEAYNEADDGTAVIGVDYLQTIAIRA